MGDNISKYMKLMGRGVGGRERFTCTLCGEEGSKTVVTLHLHESHTDSLHQCKTCGERFKGAGLLRHSKQKLRVHVVFPSCLHFCQSTIPCLVCQINPLMFRPPNFCLAISRLHMKKVHQAKFVYHWLYHLHKPLFCWMKFILLINNFRYIWYIFPPTILQAGNRCPCWLSAVWARVWQQVQKCCSTQETWGCLHI